MIKAFSAFFSCYLITVSCIAGAQPADCDTGTKFEKNLSELETVAEIAEECPAPTAGDIRQVCNEISEKVVADEDTDLSYAYQQTMWRISCAEDGKEDLEKARLKIQKMWMKNRISFSCNLPGVSVPGGNVTKFSVDTGFTDFIIDSIKDYKLDLNFLDPVDKRTIMDFVRDQIILLKKSSIDVKGKILEYERLYKLLKENGAKHAKDL